MWVLRLLTFALPWAAIAGIENPYFEPKQLLLLAGGWSLIFWQLFRQPVMPGTVWRNPMTVWVAGWVTAISLYKFHWLSLLRSPGQTQYTYNSFAWLAAVNIIMAILLVHTLATGYLRQDRNIHQLSEWLCVTAALCAAYGLLQHFGIDQWFVTDGHGHTDIPITAGFGNKGYLAIFLAALFPLHFIFSGRRYLAYAALSILVITMTHTYYALALAAIGLSASYLSRWWLRINNWMKGLSITGLAASTYATASLSRSFILNDERIGIWSLAASKLPSTTAGKAPSMTGYGLDSLPLLLGPEYQWAHNEWLQMALEIGIIGMLLIAAMAFYSTRSGWRAANHSILVSGWFGVWISLLAASFIHFPAHIPPIAWIGLCAWAVMDRNPGET